MKKVYESPKMVVEQFEANEYIAACGDMDKVYKFTCTAPGGPLYHYPTSDGLTDGIYTGSGSAELLGYSYNPCKKTHEAKISEAFDDGFVDYNGNRKCDSGEEAIVWVEYGYNWWGQKEVKNAHATKDLDMKSWEITKS